MAAKATLYRMVLPDHTCPYGVAAKERLEAEGFEVEDKVLGSREEVDEFKDRHDVQTTPLIFIEGERIGGFAHLDQHLRAQDERSE